MQRRHAASPAVVYVDPLGDGVFAPPRSFVSARKSSQTAAFGALGSRSDVRDEISSTGDFDLPWRALENEEDARACVRIHARRECAVHIALRTRKSRCYVCVRRL